MDGSLLRILLIEPGGQGPVAGLLADPALAEHEVVVATAYVAPAHIRVDPSRYDAVIVSLDVSIPSHGLLLAALCTGRDANDRPPLILVARGGDCDLDGAGQTCFQACLRADGLVVGALWKQVRLAVGRALRLLDTREHVVLAEPRLTAVEEIRLEMARDRRQRRAQYRRMSRRLTVLERRQVQEDREEADRVRKIRKTAFAFVPVALKAGAALVLAILGWMAKRFSQPEH